LGKNRQLKRKIANKKKKHSFILNEKAGQSHNWSKTIKRQKRQVLINMTSFYDLKKLKEFADVDFPPSPSNA